jgi:CPA2 family monovalent cation:H+ antiporter-2
MGWSLGAGLIFGLALSVASTVVLLRALQDRDLITSDRGRVAVGWLIVEDLVMVLSLVLIPPLAGLLGGTALPVGEDAEAVAEVTQTIGIGPIAATVLITLAKAAAFVALMLIVGQRIVPWILHFVSQTRSRELFRLSVLSIALGVAYGATHFFGVSFALGAFFAGMVMSSSTLSQQAMRETLPLRDAFAVLFFVSVGMLFNPAIILEAPLALFGTVLIIVFVKSLAAYYIVRAFGHTHEKGLTIAASLAQIGEFSFILITMGVTLDIVPTDARDLVVAGAMISILLNPLLFHLLDRREARKAATNTDAADAPSDTAEAAPAGAPAVTGEA